MVGNCRLNFKILLQRKNWPNGYSPIQLNKLLKKISILFIQFLLCIGLYAQTKKIVALSGKADFQSIQSAINSIPKNNKLPVTIFIKNGQYKEKLFIKNNFIQFEGESREGVVITQSIARDEWRCTNINDWGVATVNIDSSENISFRNLTVCNNYGFENVKETIILCDADSTGKKSIKQNGHQMAFRSFSATKLQFFNCRFSAFGGDTMSPWNTNDGMFYFKDGILEGGVDFYCPRGWSYAENCLFISKSGTAAIWHDGSQHKDSKTVLVNCSFQGFDGFKLGRFHRDAQFYLINCLFAENMANDDIYLVPTNNIIQWGRRVYYYNCKKQNSATVLFANNLEKAEGNPSPSSINASWVFNNKWSPEKKWGL
jgi:pectinesterase